MTKNTGYPHNSVLSLIRCTIKCSPPLKILPPKEIFSTSIRQLFSLKHLQVIIKQGYYSGGGGYVLSKEALRRFGNRSKKRCADDNGAEDVELGRCMERLGVKTQESLDKLG